MFLKRTIEGVLSAKRGNTEIIVVCDGTLPLEPLEDHPDVTIILHEESIGQRASINEAIKLSQAKFIMKLDAHCIMDEGFDVKLMADCEENWTVVPRLYNLHAFNWKCGRCKKEWYQSPTPTKCIADSPCDNTTDFERVIVWKKRDSRKTDFMRFDRDLHFQYWGELAKRPGYNEDIADTMSLLGACFFMHRKFYWEIGGSEESWGSWGQQGTEIACKTWLSGGRLVVNKKTWYSHMFRTQGGDFGFPYPQSAQQVENARKKSKEFFLQNTWKKQKYPLSWLLKKFWPIPGWEEEDLKRLEEVTLEKETEKGIIYYTDNKLNVKIAKKVQNNLKKIGFPIISVSLKPMNFGKNFVLKEKRGVLTMFRQILTALENSSAKIVFFCEHDVLYHPSHFDFIPEKNDVFYYNENVWKVDLKTGKALHYDCKQVSGLCCYRELAIKHYKERIRRVEKEGYSSRMGYEPGTHHRPERVDSYGSASFKSAFPNIDIRHDSNLSPTRWKKEEFRNPTKDWTEGTIDSIPGWKKEDFSL